LFQKKSPLESTSDPCADYKSATGIVLIN